MHVPRRTIVNPTIITGIEQVCTWAGGTESTARIEVKISDDDATIQLGILEARNDGRYTMQAAITLGREESIELIKILSAVI